MAGLILCAAVSATAQAQGDGDALRAHLRAAYPSLAYVERYRQDFPAEIQGDNQLWSSRGKAPHIDTPEELVAALLGLQDQHVALGGAKAGKTETLGVLFRTATDGSMVVWRVFDAAAAASLTPSDVVVAIDDVPTQRWLTQAAANTNGGNRRSRMAEAALALGLGTRAVHQIAKLGPSVKLRVRSGTQPARSVELRYSAMSGELAVAMAAAVNTADLPDRIDIDGYRVGTVRFGAFAPQYDPLFVAAANQAEKEQGKPEDHAMLAGFCAVTRDLIGKVDAINDQSDVLLVDLRGNMGGFGREARLLARALTDARLPESFDVFATRKRGTLRLTKVSDDPSCGSTRSPRPLIVLTDAGTRSAGELMAAWLWSSGAIVIGERTIGAGGGRDADAKGFELPDMKLTVKASGNFTFFDPAGKLQEGETSEARLIELVAQDKFAPSRTRPFAIQAVGLHPDIESPTTLEDLRDGGVGQVKRAVVMLRQRKLLP